MKKAYKILIRTFAVILILFTLAGAGLFWWFISEPRSLPYMSSYIEDNFQKYGNKYKVRVADSVVKWSGWESPLKIRVNNVNVMNGDGVLVGNFPEVKLGINPVFLLLGQVRFTDVSIADPIFHFKV